MIATAARTILSTLDSIPIYDNRTNNGFITYDSTLHFYNLNVIYFIILFLFIFIFIFFINFLIFILY